MCIIIEIRHDFDVSFFFRKIIEKNACFEWQLKMMMVFLCVCVLSIGPLNRQNYLHEIQTKITFEDLFLVEKNDSFRAKSYPNEEKNKLGQ